MIRCDDVRGAQINVGQIFDRAGNSNGSEDNLRPSDCEFLSGFTGCKGSYYDDRSG